MDHYDKGFFSLKKRIPSGKMIHHPGCVGPVLPKSGGLDINVGQSPQPGEGFS
jgi:hypothetical protein